MGSLLGVVCTSRMGRAPGLRGRYRTLRRGASVRSATPRCRPRSYKRCGLVRAGSLVVRRVWGGGDEQHGRVAGSLGDALDHRELARRRHHPSDLEVRPRQQSFVLVPCADPAALHDEEPEVEKGNQRVTRVVGRSGTPGRSRESSPCRAAPGARSGGPWIPTHRLGVDHTFGDLGQQFGGVEPPERHRLRDQQRLPDDRRRVVDPLDSSIRPRSGSSSGRLGWRRSGHETQWHRRFPAHL